MLSRNSRATGPKIRVPRGDLIIFDDYTCVFVKLNVSTIFTTYTVFVRTTTALTTSLFLTTPPGVACLTVQTMTSPMLAVLRPEPPRTLIVSTSRAPELSATFKRFPVESLRVTSLRNYINPKIN